MKKLIAIGLATALVVAALAASASTQTVEKFSVLAITVESHPVGHSDTAYVFRDKLKEPGDLAEVVGTAKGRCRQIDHQDAVRCAEVFFFPKGKVKTNGKIDFRDRRDRVAVIGGTRAYNGVSGKAVFYNHSRHHRIAFTLVR